jgi:hypothetical protein
MDKSTFEGIWTHVNISSVRSHHFNVFMPAEGRSQFTEDSFYKFGFAGFFFFSFFFFRKLLVSNRVCNWRVHKGYITTYNDYKVAPAFLCSRTEA